MYVEEIATMSHLTLLTTLLQWGGSPFKDLVAGLEFVKKVYGDMIDTDRMAMAGGSYG